MIKSIEIAFDGKSVELPDGKRTIPLNGVTGFFGPCGCGKTRLLTALDESVYRRPAEWTESSEGFVMQTHPIFDEKSVVRVLADKPISSDKGPRFRLVSDPFDLTRMLGGTGIGLTYGQGRIHCDYAVEITRKEPSVFEIDGPLGKLLEEVYDGNREHDFVDMKDAHSSLNCPGSLQPFQLMFRLLYRRILLRGDILALDNAGDGMDTNMATLYAKLVVLLYKQLGIQILYSSHSPDFTESIQAYMSFYGNMDSHATNYVLRHSESGFRVEHVLENGDVDKVFDMFNRHYDLLNEETGGFENGGKEPESWPFWAIKTEYDR